jgi:hypothetical protein
VLRERVKKGFARWDEVSPAQCARIYTDLVLDTIDDVIAQRNDGGSGMEPIEKSVMSASLIFLPHLVNRTSQNILKRPQTCCELSRSLRLLNRAVI